MINTKFVFGVSIVAIMAVGVAHADIAATTYFKGNAPITVSNGTISVAVDTELKSNSTYPVQNKVINTALSGKQAKLTTTNVTTTGTGNVVTAVSASDGKVTVTKGTTLATVATSGSYDDLSNKPTIPSGALASKSTISNADVADNAAIAQSKISGLTSALSGKQATISDLADIRDGAEAGATAVQPGTLTTELAKKENASNKVNALTDTTDKDMAFPTVELTETLISEANNDVMDSVNTKLASVSSSGTGSVVKAVAKDGTAVKATLGYIVSSDIINGTIKNEDISDSAAIAINKISGLQTALNAKEVGANKLTSTATTTVSDANEDILYPSYAKVINMIGEQVDGRLGALSEGNTNLNTRLDDLNTDITVLEEDKVSIEQGVKDKAVITNSSGNITTGTIGTGMITDEAVTSAKIADGTVALADLSSNSVNSAKIVDASVAAADLASNSVTTAKITDLNVTTAKIAAGAVTTAKIADSAVTAAKTSGVIGQIPSGSATSATYASIWVE